MTSAIDDTKPAAGVAASKADLRTNLGIAKSEITALQSNDATQDDAIAGLLSAVDALGVEAVGLTGWVDAQLAHGVIADGTTNCNTTLQNALTAAAGKVLWLGPGTIKISAQMTVTPGTTILGAGAGKTIIDATTGPTSGNEGVFLCSGTTVSLPQLASAITALDGGITFASSVASSLAHGDWVRCYDSTANSFISGEEDGFTYSVKAAAGSVAYPDEACLRTLPAARTAGALSNVVSTKLDQRGLIVRDLTVRGIGYTLGPSDGAVVAHIFYCKNLANARFSGVTAIGAGGAAILLEKCANARIIDCTLSTNTGDYNSAIHYALLSRGSGYVLISGTVLYGQRSSIDMENLSGPAHNLIATGCVIGGPGTDLFSAPGSTATHALGTHQGTFNSLIAHSIIEGDMLFEGFGHTVQDCLIRQSKAAATRLIGLGTEFGPPGDFRLIGNKIYLHQTDFNGSSGGMMLMMGSGWWDQDGGEAGSIVIADNDIYVMLNSTQPLIYLRDNDVKSPATGVFHVINNRIAHKVGASTQPFCDISITDGLELIVQGNILPASMTLGTFGTDFTRKVVSPNTIGGQLFFTGLPTSSPGVGMLYNAAGTLKIA